MTPDELSAWATDVEQQGHPSATTRDLAKLFKETGAALDEGDPRRDAASYEQLLFDLFLAPEGEFRDQWGPLAPMMTFSDGCYPPPIAHFPDEAVTHYKLREARAQLPTARARLQDFLWLRDGDHKMARRAITSYIDAFREPADGNIHLMERLDGLKRALELARTLSALARKFADVF